MMCPSSVLMSSCYPTEPDTMCDVPAKWSWFIPGDGKSGKKLQSFDLICFRSFFTHCSWWLSSCRRRSWATTTLHREPDMRHYMDLPHLWWQSFSGCQSRAVKQFTATSQICWLTIQSVPAITKHIFVWIVGPRAVWTILTVPSRNNHT